MKKSVKEYGGKEVYASKKAMIKHEGKESAKYEKKEMKPTMPKTKVAKKAVVKAPAKMMCKK